MSRDTLRTMPHQPPPELPRIVLVTGGTGALGSEIVRLLCAHNSNQNLSCKNVSDEQWRVAANYARDEKRALQLQAETGCQLMRADIGDEAQVEKLFRALVKPTNENATNENAVSIAGTVSMNADTAASAGLARLFAVVHAAGVSSDALLVGQTGASWHETMRVNAGGSFLVARAALRFLEDGGRLILLASRVGEQGAAGQGAYAASKAATLALMRSAAREGAHRNLAVNAICPGFVPSEMSTSLSEMRLEKARQSSVFARFGTPREVAATVQWLLGSDAAAISAQVIHCDSRF